jgi:hypothetical protein
MIFVLLFTDTGGLVPEEARVLRLASLVEVPFIRWWLHPPRLSVGS